MGGNHEGSGSVLNGKKKVIRLVGCRQILKGISAHFIHFHVAAGKKGNSYHLVKLNKIQNCF